MHSHFALCQSFELFYFHCFIKKKITETAKTTLTTLTMSNELDLTQLLINSNGTLVLNITAYLCFARAPHTPIIHLLSPASDFSHHFIQTAQFTLMTIPL